MFGVLFFSIPVIVFLFSMTHFRIGFFFFRKKKLVYQLGLIRPYFVTQLILNSKKEVRRHWVDRWHKSFINPCVI